MTPEKWLSDKVAESGLKNYFIAEKIGMDPKKLSATLNSHRKVNVDEFLGICKVLGINAMEYSPPTAEGEAHA